MVLLNFYENTFYICNHNGKLLEEVYSDIIDPEAVLGEGSVYITIYQELEK